MNHLKDTYRHQGKRKILIDELKQMGISNQGILEAFYKVPRHFFMDLALDDLAYTNGAFQIGSGQTISHPYTVAFQTQLLEITPKMKVLEIGTGSGFQTCILSELKTKVYSIERHQELHLKAEQIIRHLKYDARLKYGDGFAGWPSYSPFDRILVTCGAPEIPEALMQQLAIGGIMVIPVGEGVEQKMLKIVRSDENKYLREEFGTFKFVPMLESKVSFNKTSK
jgi:protein-L-isoaspartate(D-aspartate) O-methyltransferase